MNWNWKFGRIVLAAYPFVLAGALVLASIFFFSFTTEKIWSDVGHEGIVTIHPNQTYMHNVTIAYEKHEPPRGYGTRLENGSIVVEEPPFTDTLTTWQRGWLPIMIGLNETLDVTWIINRTLVGPDGIIEPWAYVTVTTGAFFGIGNPEITRGGTYRLFIQNADSKDAHVKLSWNTDWHFYEKPYFYYGIAGLVIALFYPVLFLFRQGAKPKTPFY